MDILFSKGARKINVSLMMSLKTKATVHFLYSYTAISRRRVIGKKMCTRKSPKVIWDMINTLFTNTVAVTPTFFAFL